MIPSLRTAVATTGIAGLLGLAVARAQEPPALAAPPDGAQAAENDYEIYNRGPLHEAFATPGTNEPITGQIVDQQPPEPIDEVPPEQKPEGDDVVWVPGYWAFDEELDDFLWVSGVWREVPPGRTWVPGYWTETDRGFQWVAGMWADSNEEQVTYLPEPPQSQEHGPSSPSPGDGYFWVPGNWTYYEGGYRWQPGYWAPHQRDWIWVPACYTYTPRGFVYVPGYWDYQLAYRGLAFAPVYFHNHTYRRPFAPTVALDSWGHLMLHLFVNPRHGRYYFGDYYGPRYTDYGFTPFYSYHRRSGYDPLFVYFNWRFGNDYYDRLDGWHRYFATHDDYRPRHTYREQRDFAERNRDNRVIAATTVAAALEDVVRSSDIPVSFARVSAQEREQFTEQARNLQEFTRERLQVEAQADDGRDQQGRERASLRIQGNERLRLRHQDGREDVRERAQAPEQPDQMQDVQPDDRDGARARVPAPHSRERGESRTRPETGQEERPDRRNQREQPEIREPDRPERVDTPDRPETGGRRDLPRLPDGVPGVEPGERERPDRGERPSDRGRSEREQSGRPERGVPDRDQRPERRVPEQGVPDQGTPEQRPERRIPEQRPEQGVPDRRPERNVPDQGTPEQQPERRVPEQRPERNVPEREVPERRAPEQQSERRSERRVPEQQSERRSERRVPEQQSERRVPEQETPQRRVPEQREVPERRSAESSKPERNAPERSVPERGRRGGDQPQERGERGRPKLSD